MKITATTHNEFVVETGESTADNRAIVQRCFLGGNILRSVPCKKGEINLFLPIRITLGPVSFEAVTKLKANESVVL